MSERMTPAELEALIEERARHWQFNSADERPFVPLARFLCEALTAAELAVVDANQLRLVNMLADAHHGIRAANLLVRDGDG